MDKGIVVAAAAELKALLQRWASTPGADIADASALAILAATVVLGEAYQRERDRHLLPANQADALRAVAKFVEHVRAPHPDVALNRDREHGWQQALLAVDRFVGEQLAALEQAGVA